MRPLDGLRAAASQSASKGPQRASIGGPSSPASTRPTRKKPRIPRCCWFTNPLLFGRELAGRLNSSRWTSLRPSPADQEAGGRGGNHGNTLLLSALACPPGGLRAVASQSAEGGSSELPSADLIVPLAHDQQGNKQLPAATEPLLLSLVLFGPAAADGRYHTESQPINRVSTRWRR